MSRDPNERFLYTCITELETKLVIDLMIKPRSRGSRSLATKHLSGTKNKLGRLGRVLFREDHLRGGRWVMPCIHRTSISSGRSRHGRRARCGFAPTTRRTSCSRRHQVDQSNDCQTEDDRRFLPIVGYERFDRRRGQGSCIVRLAYL
jgi:hypothetical protein